MTGAGVRGARADAGAELLRWVRPALAGLALGFGAWVLGMDVGHAAAVTLAGAGVALVVGSVGRVPDATWPDDPHGDAGRGWHGAALQSRLLERLDAEPARVPRLLLPRLRALLVGVLARRGIGDPRCAQARELVGAELYDLLSRPTWTARDPTATDLTDAVLGRLEQLDATGAGGGAPDTSSGTPAASSGAPATSSGAPAAPSGAPP